jgi:energy-coupling factor transport system permease protein
MNMLLPGMYMDADSVLHHLDPRVKVGAALILMALVLTVHSLASYILLTICVIAIAILSAAPPAALLRTLGAIFWLGCFMFVFRLFTTPGQPLLAVGQITLTWEGLLAGTTQVYRLCLLVIISALLTFTTSPTQLAHGLEAMFKPLIRIGLPVREFVLVLTIALRFAPVLLEEIDKISKAQQARGVDMYSKNPFRQMQSWSPLFVPIFVAAFRRAEELSTAMEARGFRGAQYRTRLYQLSISRRDLLAILIILIFSLVLLGMERVV